MQPVEFRLTYLYYFDIFSINITSLFERTPKRTETTKNQTAKRGTPKKSPEMKHQPGRSPAVVRLSIDRIEKNIESIESKIAKIFKRLKNLEDGSDFDNFLTESIVSA